MDSLVGLLDGPRARGAFVLRSVMEPPWSLRIEDEAPLTVLAMVEGHAWVFPDDADAQKLLAGDVAVLRGPNPYTFKDDPETPVNIIIGPGQVCTTLHGESVAERMDLGVRAWGNNLNGSVTMLVGTYEHHSEVGERLLRSLPDLVVIPAGTADLPIVELLNHEIGKEEPGQEAVLDRLLDLLAISVLRAWFARPEADTPAWYLAYGDPVVGPAIRLMQNEPGHQWTVALLANAVGVSRATLARRFTEMVGVPPMTYLTEWRIAVAADLLRNGNMTIGAVASHVGYGSPFALSTAFKRIQGVSPAQYRQRAATG